MKKLLFIALFLIPFLGISQTTKPIDSFLGIKFGSSQEAVKAAIIAKGGVLNKDSKDPDLLIFLNVKLGGRPTSFVFVKFINNKAYAAYLLFDAGLESQVISYYKSLLNDIADVYGTGSSLNVFKEGYKEGEQYETLGISTGNVEYKHFWLSNNNSINISITTDFTVKLVYQDGALTDEVIAKQKAQDKSDL